MKKQGHKSRIEMVIRPAVRKSFVTERIVQ